MVQFFNDAGLLVHYDEAYEELSKLVIIDPQWLAHVMRVCFVAVVSIVCLRLTFRVCVASNIIQLCMG